MNVLSRAKRLDSAFFMEDLNLFQLISETGLHCLRGEKIWTVKNFDSKVCCFVN
ncbi:hypothetical protein OIU74_024797, partial [Salix koriyanagi]